MRKTHMMLNLIRFFSLGPVQKESTPLVLNWYEYGTPFSILFHGEIPHFWHALVWVIFRRQREVHGNHCGCAHW